MPEYFEIVFIKRPTKTAGQEIAMCLKEMGIQYGRHSSPHFGGRELVVTKGYAEEWEYNDTFVSIPDVVFTREHFSSELAPFREFVQRAFDGDENVSLAVCMYEIAVNFLIKAHSFEEVADPGFLRLFPIVFRRSPDDGSVIADFHFDAQGIFSDSY
jgi:hypothetical protein